MTRRILRYAAACSAAIICLTSCDEKVSLMTTQESGPESDRSFSVETEIVTTPKKEAENEGEEEKTADKAKNFSVDIAKPKGHKIPKKSVIKKFKTVMQEPELPTGCEVTSLCQTLNFLGFDIDKIKLADEFMPIDFSGSTTMDHAYIGDPKLCDGFGCFPPVIVQTADSYFESIDSPCYAEDMSGIDLEKLFYQIEMGRPVIAWVTIDLVELAPEHRWTTSDGEEMWFSGMQHCVTVYGYDLKKKIIYVADPLKGNMEYDLERFTKMFDMIGQKAVVICGDSETEGHYNRNKDYKKSTYLTRVELELQEEAKRIGEEAARKAEEEVRKAEEEAAKQAEEEARKAEEEAARQAEEEARKAEEEARRAEEEAKKAEEAAKTTTTKVTTTKAKTTSVKTTPVQTTTKKKTTSVKTSTVQTTTKKKTTSVKTSTVHTTSKKKTTSVKVNTTKAKTTTAKKGGKK